MQNRKDVTRGRINGTAAARDTNSELLPLARPPPWILRGERNTPIGERSSTRNLPACPFSFPGNVWKFFERVFSFLSRKRFDRAQARFMAVSV